MKRKGEKFKYLLYKLLSFENYLFIISQFYFISFYLGLLKRNKLYEYPYFLKNIIKEKNVVLDIGANLGYLTKLFSQLVKREGLVYAIEPIQPILNILNKNTRRLKNVKILPYALGKENKNISLGNNSISTKKFIASGSNFIIDSNITEDTKAIVEFQAEMRKGSELFQNLTRLDFIKIDVEGYEMVIVEDMDPIISKFRPVMLIESRLEKRKKLLLYLNERNYSAFVLHNHFLYPTDENEFWDMLSIPNEKLDDYKKFIKNYVPLTENHKSDEKELQEDIC